MSWDQAVTKFANNEIGRTNRLPVTYGMKLVGFLWYWTLSASIPEPRPAIKSVNNVLKWIRHMLRHSFQVHDGQTNWLGGLLQRSLHFWKLIPSNRTLTDLVVRVQPWMPPEGMRGNLRWQAVRSSHRRRLGRGRGGSLLLFLLARFYKVWDAGAQAAVVRIFCKKKMNRDSIADPWRPEWPKLSRSGACIWNIRKLRVIGQYGSSAIKSNVELPSQNEKPSVPQSVHIRVSFVRVVSDEFD